MRWATEVHTLNIGPAGIALDGQVLSSGPLQPTQLPQALQQIRLAAGCRLRVVLADDWVKTLLLELPDTLVRAEEIRLYAEQRLRDSFARMPPGLALAIWPTGKLRGARSGSRKCLIAAVDRRIPENLRHWAVDRKLRLHGIGSAWGELAGGLVRQGRAGLVMRATERYVLGTWADGEWSGWRNAAMPATPALAAEVRRYVDTLPEAARPDTLYYLPADADAFRAHPGFAELDAATPGGALVGFAARGFDFLPALAGPGLPLRQKLLAIATLLTLAATAYVSLPDTALDADDDEIVAPAPRREPPPSALAEAATPAATDDTPPDTPEVVDVPVDWPEILGVMRSGRTRWVMYTLPDGPHSQPVGSTIAGRFRLLKANEQIVVLEDVKTGEQQEVSLASPGAEP